MNNTKNILITGATGFIGACLARRLIKSQTNIHIILRPNSNTWRIKNILNKLNLHYVDLIDTRKVEKIVKKIKPQIIYHLAAYGAYPFQKDAKNILMADIFGTLNLINACIKVGFKIFINTGSSSEYGNKTQSMSEEDLLEPNSYYAVAKAAQTLLCQYLSHENKLPIITLRPFSVYGPYEESSRLVPTLINNCLKNKDLSLASPQTARDFIFIEDMINAYLKVACYPNLSGHIFNIGTGQQSTLQEIVSLVIKLTKAKVKQNWGTMPGRSFDTNIWLADISKAKKLFKWQPRYNLEEGLKKTIIWFKKNKHLYQ